MHIKQIRKVITYLFLTLVSFFIITPFAWLVISGITPELELCSIPPHWFSHLSNLENFKKLILGGKGYGGAVFAFRRSIMNSTILAGSVAMICILVGSPAAYAFARLKFRGSNTIYSMILATQLIPMVALIAPIYLIARKLNLVDRLITLILFELPFSLPYVIWILRTYFQTIPPEIEENAMIDGCSIPQVLAYIVLPLSSPGLVAAVLLSFLGVWSEFLLPLVLTTTFAAKPVTVVISEFTSKWNVNYSLMSSGAIVGAIPPLVVAFVFQKYILKGLTTGAVKA